MPMRKRRRLGRGRKAYYELGPSSETVAERFDGATVDLDESANDREPDSQSRLRPTDRSFHLREQVEDLREKFGGDALSVVANIDFGSVAHAPTGQGNVPPGIREFGGIVEQIRKHLGESNAVAVDGEVGIWERDVQRDFGLVEVRPTNFDGHFQDRGKAERLDVEPQFASGDAGNVEQVVDEANELADLSIDNLPSLVDGGRIAGPEAHNFQGITNWSERIP